MTLTAAEPVTAPTAAAVRSVHALVVTGSSPLGVASVLDALRTQVRGPDDVVVLDRTRVGIAPVGPVGPAEEGPQGRPDAAPGPFLRTRRLEPDTSTRRAVTDEVLDGRSAGRLADDDLVWVLPAGTVPEPDALGHLLDAHRRSPSVGVAGPKLVDAEDPLVLHGVGISATRTGRVVDDPADGAPDQGQYDQRRDVLAVPAAGALVEVGVLGALRGWERTFGDLGGDLDLGWRAHALGRRVVLAPSARVRAGAGVLAATATTPARRRAARRVALARAPWYAAPFLALWILVSSLVAALGLLLLKRPRAAWTELGDVGALDPVRWVLATWRTRGRRGVRRRDLRGLFVPGAAIARRVADRVHDALVRPRPASEDPRPDSAHRSVTSRMLRHPGLWTVLLAAAATVAAGRTLPGRLGGRFDGGLSGGELVGARGTASALWEGYLDGWHGPGLGGTGPAEPHLAVLAAPTWVLERLPGSVGSISPSGAVVALLLSLTLPLGVASAYLAARVLTRTRWLRAAAALAWVSTGAATAALAGGRLGAAAALVLLPAVAAGLVLLARSQGTATGAFATALGAAALGAFAPALLVLVLVLALAVLALGAPASRSRAAVVLIVPLVLLGPWLLDVVRDWRLLTVGPGLAQWGGDAPPPWQLALLHPGGAGSGLLWSGVPIVALGLLGLARGRATRSLSGALAATVVLSLAGVLASPLLTLARVPAGVPGSGAPVTPWQGIFMFPLALALLASALLGIDALRARRGPARADRAARRLGTLGGALLLGGALTATAALAWTGLGGELRSWTDPRPAVAIEHADGDPAGRTLFVAPGPDGAAYRLVGREMGALARSLPEVGPADAALAPTVGALLDGTRPEVVENLDADAVGVLAVDRAAGDDLRRRLDSTEGLTRMAPRGTWDYWRVTTGDTGESGSVAPPRLRVLDGEVGRAVPTTGQNAATSTGLASGTTGPEPRLLVAQPRGWAEHATVRVDGRTLVAAPGGDRPAYPLPADGGDLVVDVSGDRTWWHLLQGLALALTVFLAIPFGNRESRRRQ